MIRHKKNDLLYKDITCLYHSHAQLWVLCLVVLFMLVLRLALTSVGTLLGGSVPVGAKVLFLLSALSTQPLFLTVLFCLAFGGAALFVGCLFSGSFLGLLLCGSIVVGTLYDSFSLFLS